MQKLLIITPYNGRDLNGHALLGYYLMKKYNIECEYINGYGVEQKVLAHRADGIVIDHASWNFKADLIRFCKGLGIPVFVLPTEGFFFNHEIILQLAGLQKGIMHLIDHQFVWGDYVLDALDEKGLYRHDQYSKTGHPRFDYYHPSLHSFFPSREEFMHNLGFAKPHNTTILWATNTPYIFWPKEKIIQRYTKKAHFKAEAVEDMLHDQELQYNASTSIISELAQRHAEYNFIIKVHPAERVDHYDTLVEKHPNIKLGYNTSIHPFLMHSEVLFQRNCTTATEAWFMGKPTLQLEGENYRRKEYSAYADGSITVRTTQDTEEAIEHILKNPKTSDSIKAKQNEFILQFFGTIDGKAHQRVGDALAQWMNKGDVALKQKHLSILYPIAEKQYWQERHSRLPAQAKKVLGLDPDQSFRFWKKKRKDKSEGEKEPTSQEVEEIYAKLSKLLPY